MKKTILALLLFVLSFSCLIADSINFYDSEYGLDATPTIATITTTGIPSGSEITEIQITTTMGNATYIDDWYGLNLNINGTDYPSVGWLSAESYPDLNNLGPNDLTITATSEDLDDYSDSITITLSVDVFYNPPAGTPDVPTLVSPSPGAINLAIDTNLEWTSGENTDHAVLYLADNAEFTGATIVNPASSPYQTSLTNGTNYFWKVVAVGPTAVEMSSVVSSFRTEYGVISDFPWNEDFEDDDFDWTVIDNNNDDDAWLTNASGYAYDGAQSASIHTDYNDGDNDDYLITPQLALTGGERLKFWSRVRSAAEAENFEVLLSTTGKNPEDFTETILSNASYINTSYEEINIDLSAYSGDCYLAFHVPADETDGYYLYLDNVTIEEIPASPIVEISTEAIEFGTVVLNESSESEIISLSNIGGGTLNITNVVITGSDADQFSFEDSEDYALTATEDLLIEVTFNPTSAGEKTATLQITDDLTRQVYEISLTATGLDTNINEINIPYTQDFETEIAFLGWTSNINSSATSATADRYSYSYNAHNGTYSYKVYSSTDAATSAELISPLVVPDMDAYRIKFWAKTSTIANTEAIVVGKYNQAMDSFTAIDTLEITTSYAQYTVNMAAPERANERIAFQFSFTATSQYLYIDDILFEEAPEGSLVQITPDVKEFGEVLVGYEESQLFTVYNNGSQAAQITEIVAPNGYNFESSETTPFSLEVAESFTITVSFNPQAEMLYSGNLVVKEAAGFTPVSHNVALSGTGIPVPQGANCSDPLALAFPAVDITGNTEGLIDDYSSAWISPSSSYLNGDDAVYQFTLDNTMVLNGSITTSGTYIGAFILEDEPNLETPAEVVLSKTNYSNILTYTNNVIEAGTYYLIISSYPSPQSLDYTINLTADPLPIPVAASYPSPATEAIDLPVSSLTLAWTNAAYTESIDLYFGQAGARDMVKVLDNVPAVEEWQTPELLTNTSYNWKVINRNYSGETIDSLVTTWSFTTIGQAPEAVAYTSPADDATDISISGNLTWQTADRANGYNVYFSTDETFASVTPVDQTETSYAFSGLDYSTTYYWKVIPYNVVGSPTEGILTWSFTTMEDPTIAMPVNINFEGSTENPLAITLENFLIGIHHGAPSNIMYKNVYSASSNGYIQFQAMNNITETSVIKFAYRVVQYSTGNPATPFEDDFDYLIAKVSTDNGENFTVIDQINSTNHVDTTDFTNYSIDISSYAGQTAIFRFEMNDDTVNDYWFDIDNIYFGEPTVEPVATLSTNELDFGIVNINEIGSDLVNIINTGAGILNVSTIEIVGPNASEFSYSTVEEASMALAENELLGITIKFIPTSVGPKDAELQITDDLGRVVRFRTQSRNTNSVALSGEGFDPSIAIPFTLDFEGTTTVPSDYITDTNMYVTSDNHGNISNVMYKNIYSTYSNAYIQFQAINSVESSSVIEFDYRFVDYSSPYSGIEFVEGHDYLIAKVSLDAGNTFTVIDQINSTNHVVSDEYAKYSINIGSYVGQNPIFRFEMNDDTVEDYWFDIDNIHFGEATPDIPVNVTIAATGTIEITWSTTNNVSYYNVYACDTPDGDNWELIASVPGLSYSYTGTENMKFFKVKGSSEYVNPNSPAKRSKRKN
jgi:hypothetical protein